MTLVNAFDESAASRAFQDLANSHDAGELILQHKDEATTRYAKCCGNRALAAPLALPCVLSMSRRVLLRSPPEFTAAL